MQLRRLLGIALVLCIGAILALPGAPAAAVSDSSPQRRVKPTPTPTHTPTPTPSGSRGTFVKIYSNFVDSVQSNLTPEDVQLTSDGGAILLGITQAPQSSNGVGVSLLVKTDASGTPQWQEELGCFGTPPGDYTDGVSIQQTTDGGYVVAGGTIGCGSASVCPSTSGIQCALVEKLDSTGKPSWTKVYPAGVAGSAISQIKQTTDGGYIAVGTATNGSQITGGLVLKLDSQGVVQWQRLVGPNGSTQVYFKSVQQTSDNGYIAAGEFVSPTANLPPTSVLAVKFESNGNVQWQQGFNTVSSTGSLEARIHAQSVIQASDGGYLIGGNWVTSPAPGECCAGALLLKLGSTGGIQWQFAYTGGTSCSYQSCFDITGIIYSVHQTIDGGYVAAGAFDGSVEDTLVPWLAKVDSSGNLVWQHPYFEINPSTLLPYSEYFAASTLTNSGGVQALGFTEDPTTLVGNFFNVKTDSSGLVGTCSDVRSATAISATNPALVSIPPALPVQTVVTTSANGASTTLATSINTQAKC